MVPPVCPQGQRVPYPFASRLAASRDAETVGPKSAASFDVLLADL